MSNQRSVAIIQTSMVSTQVLKGLFNELLPKVKLYNIIDDSLIDEVNAFGYPNKNVVRRLCSYYLQAASLGVDCILNQCSSVGEVADMAAGMIDVPVIRIDSAMAQMAVDIGSNISLIATCSSTVSPSKQLILKAAEKANKRVNVDAKLVDGAMMLLIKTGNVEKHNSMVIEAVKEASLSHDVIVLAQGSMVVLEEMLKDIKVPVLTSPRLGVLSVKKYLDSLT